MLTWERVRGLFTAVCDTDGAPRISSTRFSLLRVYTQDIPALLAFNRWLVYLTAGFFFAGILAGALLAKMYPLATEALLNAYAQQLRSLGGLESITTGAILRNNMRVMVLNPALGLITLGVFPLIVAAMPGVILGMLAAQADAITPLRVFVGLILLLPHGVFELPAIAIGTAFSLRLPWSLIRPVSSLGAAENAVWAAMNIIKAYVFLVIPLLIVAAWVEVNVSGRIARWLIGLSAVFGLP